MRHKYPKMYWELVQVLTPEDAIGMLAVADATKTEEGASWLRDTSYALYFCEWRKQGEWMHHWRIVAELQRGSNE